MTWALFSKFKGYIIGAGLVLASILGIYLKGRNDGAENAEDKAKDALDEDVQSQKDITEDVSGLSSDELDSRLSDWTRKG